MSDQATPLSCCASLRGSLGAEGTAVASSDREATRLLVQGNATHLEVGLLTASDVQVQGSTCKRAFLQTSTARTC
jgi:hypothetical protein